MSPSGAPGVNTAATPAAAKRGRSSSGMMPPAKTNDVVEITGAQLVDDLRDERHVRAGQDRQANGVGVFLQCRLRHELGRLEQAGVHDLEPRVAQGPCDHFGPPIVSVQPGLGDDDAVASQHRLTIAKDRSWPPLVPAAPTSSCSSRHSRRAAGGVPHRGRGVRRDTRSKGSVVCGQLNIGSATDVRNTLQSGGPYFQTGGAGCGFWLALADGDIVAYKVEQPQQCTLKLKGDHWECGARRSPVADLAQYPVSIQTVGQTDSVIMDLLPPGRSRRRPFPAAPHRQPRLRRPQGAARPRQRPHDARSTYSTVTGSARSRVDPGNHIERRASARSRPSA